MELCNGLCLAPPPPPSSPLPCQVNTCGFLGKAREEGDEVIRRLVAAKEARAARGDPCAVVVTGCMVNLHKEAVLERHPGVDHLVSSLPPCPRL